MLHTVFLPMAIELGETSPDMEARAVPRLSDEAVAKLTKDQLVSYLASVDLNAPNPSGRKVGEFYYAHDKSGASFGAAVRTIRGSFPYNSRAVLSNGGKNGRPKKEEFLPGAFRWSLDTPSEEIHLLAGHDYDRPLASKKAGTLTFNDTEQSLNFTARIHPEIAKTSWAQDLFAMIKSGIQTGLSIGFQIPPTHIDPRAETVIEEDPREGRALIRRISNAILHELSIVTRPAYRDSAVEARSWDLPEKLPDHSHLKRWRL